MFIICIDFDTAAAIIVENILINILSIG